MSASNWERYWRGGYTVEGASDVLVDNYCRREEEAAHKGRLAAEEAIEHLKALGITGTVTVWTEAWRTRRVEESDDRAVVEVLTTQRRLDPIDLTHSGVGVEVGP